MRIGIHTTGAWFQGPHFLHSSHLRFKLQSSVSYSKVIPCLQDECKDFLPWLRRKSGTEISSILSIGSSVYGRSLFASEFIQAGDCILKVPFNVQITPDNVLPEINSFLGKDIGNTARLSIVILVEKKMGQDSEWAPYINSLPRVGEMHSTIFWTKDDLEMVKKSAVYQETINQQAQIEKEYLSVRPALDHFPEFFEDITLKDFMHAHAIVGSRAWGSSKGLSLVPFADFLNHDGVSEALLLSDEDKQTSEVIADRDYAPGEEVLIRYGKFPNATLLMDFGFTLPYNIYDQVQICVSVPQVRSAKGKGRGIPQSLRACARILSATSIQELKELVTEAAQNDGRLARRPLKNRSREIEAHKLLLLQVFNLIQEYGASIESLGPTYASSVGVLALRRKMALDLLTGELRVLRSASSWLKNYCATLSGGNNHA
ncbi:PREDICTED: ribulose-1,5 bisphosphate carboxylase/oxygenase large subunit N-methyltransferase, chloroplastic isoform X4 [Nelumbo nucifera]|uniref:Ribulose-1,5 bisphosphate carboxylase/oxygenase large subunit N-methyltransferase, chloroplastic isoform X4 n=1 Tax=Nelumbo nucifera TaxID=4432 RepID=A0A1U8Q441_NELNU|nr:PREDICTED: ribulose-1,5 bisphosphate carboxylase/oxygenase large subunit N-methyltransferase, chloroplastic isoform X4 [Nelumbo nucifera]